MVQVLKNTFLQIHGYDADSDMSIESYVKDIKNPKIEQIKNEIMKIKDTVSYIRICFYIQYQIKFNKNLVILYDEPIQTKSTNIGHKVCDGVYATLDGKRALNFSTASKSINLSAATIVKDYSLETFKYDMPKNGYVLDKNLNQIYPPLKQMIIPKDISEILTTLNSRCPEIEEIIKNYMKIKKIKKINSETARVIVQNYFESNFQIR